jgi:3-hydroxyisobutyrate dehydrogenase
MTPRVGFIGVGDMGGPIAQRIIDAGFPTTLWSRRTESLTQFRPGSFTPAATKADLGAASEVVGLCVFGDDDVREVCLGAHGLFEAMTSGSVVLIHSTNSVAACEEIAAEGENRGIQVLDAPVSGASAGAEAGTLTIMVGGDRHALDKALPVLRSYGGLIRLLGPVGSGQKMKVLNNALSNSNGELAIIAIRTGIEFGLDPVSVVEVLRSGGAQSFSLHNLITRLVPDPDFVEHARAMIAKDLSLFADARKHSGLEPTLLEELAGLRAGDPAPRFLADAIGHTLGTPYSQVPAPAV